MVQDVIEPLKHIGIYMAGAVGGTIVVVGTVITGYCSVKSGWQYFFKNPDSEPYKTIFKRNFISEEENEDIK